MEAQFTARADFPNLVEEFLQGIGNNWRAPQPDNLNPRAEDMDNAPQQSEMTTHAEPEEPHNPTPQEPNQFSRQETQIPVTPKEQENEYQHTRQQHTQADRYLTGNLRQERERCPLMDRTNIANTSHNGESNGGQLKRTKAQSPPRSRSKVQCRFGPRTAKKANKQVRRIRQDEGGAKSKDRSMTPNKRQEQTAMYLRTEKVWKCQQGATPGITAN